MQPGPVPPGHWFSEKPARIQTIYYPGGILHSAFCIFFQSVLDKNMINSLSMRHVGRARIASGKSQPAQAAEAGQAGEKSPPGAVPMKPAEGQ
jgi:hypothetical protein